MFRMLRVKPPHGWNAVAWELGIVTLGVLIALGAQQWAEWRGWTARVAVADTAIRQELSEASVNARERLAFNDCQVSKLDEIEALLLGGQRTFAKPPFVSRYWAIIRLWPRDAWETALSNDVVAHMEPKRAAGYSSIYNQLGQVRDEEALEQQQIAGLGILPRWVGAMSEATRDRLLAAAVLARRDNEMIQRDSRQVVDAVRALGIADLPGEPLTRCNSLHEPMSS